MNKEVLKFVADIEELGWNVTIDNETSVSLQKYSPPVQDFNIYIETEI